MKRKKFKSLLKENIRSIISGTIGCISGAIIMAAILHLFDTGYKYLIYGLAIGGAAIIVQLIITAISSFKSSSN